MNPTATSADTPAPRDDGKIEQHPPGLYLLFVTEMWERFSFYGMKAFLILFMTLAIAEGGLAWPTEKAGQVLAWYLGLVYLTPIFGGYFADRFLGTHLSMVIGGLVIAAGHFTLAAMDFVPPTLLGKVPIFYTGLALIVVGTGFFKPCVSVMVGQLYGEHDRRRDAAFTIFYMGINLGAFLGPFICGALRISQQDEATGVWGWSWAFGAAGVGMVLGLIAYFIGRPFLLKGIGLPESARGQHDQPVPDGWICRDCGANLAGQRPDAKCPRCEAPIHESRRRRPLTHEERQRVAVIFIMAFFVIFFWTAFEQAGGSMNLFAEHRTDRSIPQETATAMYRFAAEPNYLVPWYGLSLLGAVLLGGWAVARASLRDLFMHSRLANFLGKSLGLGIGGVLLVLGILKGGGFLGKLFPETLLNDPTYPTEWFQSVNPLFILLFAPAFASLWIWLGRRNAEPSTPIKFAIGLILLGCGFMFMVLGAQASRGEGGEIVKVSGYYLLATYCVATLAELCLSPVGLSMVTKLSPVHLVSLLMGVWFMANFFANLFAGYLTGYSERIAETGFVFEGLAGFFFLFVVAPIVAGIVVLILSPMLKKMMHGVG